MNCDDPKSSVILGMCLREKLMIIVKVIFKRVLYYMSSFDTNEHCQRGEIS